MVGERQHLRGCGYICVLLQSPAAVSAIAARAL